MLDDNFKQHCKEVQGKAKLVKGKKNVDVQYDSRRTSIKREVKAKMEKI